MRVRLINTDNPECEDLLYKRKRLIIDGNTGEFDDLSFLICDKFENDKIIKIDSQWHTYTFSKVKG